MSRRSPSGPISYPSGDHPFGVVFYRVQAERLSWEDCWTVILAIAEEFIREGPFLVRIGHRPVQGGREYWVGFNAEAVGRAFERDIDIRAYRITRALKLPGTDSPPRLKRVLSEEDVRRLRDDQPEPELEDELAAAAPSASYEDHYFGVVFYRLEKAELAPQFALEAVRDVADMLFRPVGSALPIVIRCRLMDEPPNYYWVALNSTAGGMLFERMLSAQRVRVKRQLGPPSGFGNPTLRSVFQVEGVPVQPPGSVPALAPQPGSRRAPQMAAPPEEPPRAQRDRMAWARSVDLGGRVSRLRNLARRRRPQQDPDE